MHKNEEYRVYTYDLPCDKKKIKGTTSWAKQMATPDENQALTEAARLFNTRRFIKVEVKKCYVDQRTQVKEHKLVKRLGSSSHWFLRWLGCR